MHAEPSSLICLKFAFQERSIRDVKAQVLFHTILQEADFYNILFTYSALSTFVSLVLSVS